MVRAGAINDSDLQIILFFYKKINLQKALIPFIGVKILPVDFSLFMNAQRAW